MKEYKNPTVMPGSKYFLILKGTEMIKLRLGMTQSEVIEVLGEPYFVNEGSNPKNQKLIFKMNGENKWYEALFTNNFLTRALKIDRRIKEYNGDY
jgi:hypothetical protein